MPKPAPGRCDGSASFRLARDGEWHAEAGPCSGMPVEAVAVENTGHRLDAAEHLLVIGLDESGVFGPCLGHRQEERLDVSGVHAQVDLGEIPEAVNGQPGAGEQASASANSPMTRTLRRRWRACAGSGRPPSFRASAGSMRVANHAGAQPNSSPASVEMQKREQQDGKVEAEVGLRGQRAARHGGDKPAQ